MLLLSLSVESVSFKSFLDMTFIAQLCLSFAEHLRSRRAQNKFSSDHMEETVAYIKYGKKFIAMNKPVAAQWPWWAIVIVL